MTDLLPFLNRKMLTNEEYAQLHGSVAGMIVWAERRVNWCSDNGYDNTIYVELLKALEDARRWRALNHGRLHFMGSAGFDFSDKKIKDSVPIPKVNQTLHFGMEFWSEPLSEQDKLRFPYDFERRMLLVFVDEVAKREGL